MDIDSMDNKVMSMGSKDHHHHHHHHHHQSMIMKGKRTKRPRQPSPASAVFTASSCSSGGDGGGGGGGGDNKMHTKIRSSESLCSEILSTGTEEDEDMANCLILLAQSGHDNTMSSTTIHINNNNIEKQGGVEIIKSEKIISSRKFKEMTTSSSSTIGGKVGIFVYECKTCNRSFPSFQALGGHRTSHKKHKPTAEMEEKKRKKFPPLDDHHHHEGKKHDEDEEKGKKYLKISLEIAKKNSRSSVVINGNNNNNINKVKIHECSICGAEFSSGQALGGHMRRHRIIPTTPTAETSHDDGGERPRNILELDLNLPAPLEDDQFPFSLFSSSRALVDCQF